MKHFTVMMTTALALTSLSLAGVNAASAQQNMGPQARISVSQLTKQLEDKGYTIREIDRKSNGWEVEVLDRNHEKLELRINSQGKIIRQRIDD